MKTKRYAVLMLASLFIGVLMGAETVRLSVYDVCPKALCADRARIIPVNDREYYGKALHEIKGAQSSIHMALFEIKYYENYQSSGMNDIVDELISARQRGVEVLIIVDQYSRENNAMQRLLDNGVEIRYDSNETTLHAKLIIIDGMTVILGSTNLSYYGLEMNNEANVMIVDEATAKEFEGYFQTLWSDG